LGYLEELRLTFHHHENAQRTNEPELLFSPAEIRQAREAIIPDEDILKQAIEEFRDYLFPLTTMVNAVSSSFRPESR
jgi:hypothetical protein